MPGHAEDGQCFGIRTAAARSWADWGGSGISKGLGERGRAAAGFKGEAPSAETSNKAWTSGEWRTRYIRGLPSQSTDCVGVTMNHES